MIINHALDKSFAVLTVVFNSIAPVELFALCVMSVPRASIVWLARAVNVVRPVALRLHIDRARFATDGRLRSHARNLHG